MKSFNSNGSIKTFNSSLDQLTALFRLLSDKTRLNILMLLADGERNVSWLCNELRLPQPTVSHHLGLLRISDILETRREGKQVYYALNGRVDFGTHSSSLGHNEMSIHAANYVVRIGRNEPSLALSLRGGGHSVDIVADELSN